jgi:hypothetical protein
MLSWGTSKHWTTAYIVRKHVSHVTLLNGNQQTCQSHDLSGDLLLVNDQGQNRSNDSLF